MSWWNRLRGKKATDPNAPKAPAKPKSALREWVDAIVFAVVVAVLLRTFLLEAFLIPTPSMERSLLVGDFLFVSKLHYGPRLPMTPFALPLVHNKIPGTHVKSFIDGWHLPYLRIPGFTTIERNEVVVFNFPADDVMPNDPQLGPVEIPSLKENYIKRCLAIPGDTLRVEGGYVFVNGERAPVPPFSQQSYLVQTNGEDFNPLTLEKLGFRDPRDPNTNWAKVRNNIYLMQMTDTLAQEIRQFSNVVDVRKDVTPASSLQEGIYPGNLSLFPWNLDYFGPIWVPKKGTSIPLNERNVALYRRCIEGYEGHTLTVSGSQVQIDGQPATDYTFQMDYYWMMGDNRKNSLDSRFFGFVPEDHIVGKPLFVLLSVEGGIRWDRFFTGIR